jgi:hypothetical protein
LNFKIWVVLAIGFIGKSALADSWPSPTVQSSSSPNGEFLLRVVPSEDWGNKKALAIVFSFEGTKYTQKSTFNMTNEISPSKVLITDFGTTFSFDNWGELGLGYVVVVYSAGGDILNKYTLNQLYDEDAIRKIKQSVSSVWWRDTTAPPWTYQDIVCVKDSIGGSFMFNSMNGEFTYSKGEGCRLAQ